MVAVLAFLVSGLVQAEPIQVEIQKQIPRKYTRGSILDRGVVGVEALNPGEDATVDKCLRVANDRAAAGAQIIAEILNGPLSSYVSRTYPNLQRVVLQTQFHYVDTASDMAYVGWTERLERINEGMRKEENFQIWWSRDQVVTPEATRLVIKSRSGYQNGCRAMGSDEIAEFLVGMAQGDALGLPIVLFGRDALRAQTLLNALQAVYLLGENERKQLGEVHLVADYDGGIFNADAEIKAWSSGYKPFFKQDYHPIGIELEYTESSHISPEAIRDYLRNRLRS